MADERDIQEAVMAMIASDREEAEGRASEAEAEVERLRSILARCVGETPEDEAARLEALGDPIQDEDDPRWGVTDRTPSAPWPADPTPCGAVLDDPRWGRVTCKRRVGHGRLHVADNPTNPEDGDISWMENPDE